MIFLSVLAFAIYIAVSIFRLQNGYVEGFEINQKAQNTKIETVDGIRGNIYADDGSLLATSVPTYDLYWDSKVPALSKEYFLEKVDSISMLFARFFPEKTKRNGKRDSLVSISKAFNTLPYSRIFHLIKSNVLKRGLLLVEEGIAVGLSQRRKESACISWVT